jgi:co-chaperonin GroES (HSP10)|tara:strand:- start:329 stop:739 length:411 start_codon:yes stop_codon:yes gene_type:complete
MNYENALAEAFPAVDAGIQPFGSRILVQIRTTQAKTAGGIILTADTLETDKWNTQVAKVIAIGPLAFKNRNTMESWPEGKWCNEGDFVRVGKYGGDRWEAPIPDAPHGEAAMFVIFNDLDIIGRVEGDPLKVKAFI